MNRAQRLMACCVVPALLVLGGCQKSLTPATLESAQARLAKGEQSAAIIELHSVIQADPGSGQARTLLGKTLLAMGDAAGAEVELRKAKDLKEPDAEVVPWLAKAMVNQEHQKAVLEQFGNLDLKDEPAQDELNAMLANSWARAGKRDRAKPLLEAILKRTPNHVDALQAYARIHATEGRLDDAVAFATRATTADERSVEALNTLAQIQLLGKRDLDKATVAYKKIVALRPGQANAYLALVAIAMARGDKDAAAATYKDMAKALPKHPQTRLVEAQLALSNKDYIRARDLTLDLLKLAPDNPDLLNMAGLAELELNGISRAIALFQKAVYVAPEVSGPRIGLARAYLRSGQARRTIQVLESNLTRNPLDLGALTLTAEAELMGGNAEKAEALFQRALKSKPGDPSLRTSVAMSQIAQGKSENALIDLQALAISEKTPIGDLALVSAMMRRRDMAGALKAIDGLVSKLPPESPQPDALRAQVLLNQRDLAGARTQFDAALKKDALYMPAIQGLAMIDRREGKPEQAEARFSAALKADPKNLTAILALVEIKSHRASAQDEITKLLEEAIAANPNDPTPRLVQMRLLLGRRDRKAALSAAQSAVGAFPDNIELLSALGHVQLMSGDANQAIATFSKLGARDTLTPQAPLRIAEAYVQLKDFPAAERNYKRALELSPTLLDAQRGLIAVSVRANDPKHALEAARTIQRQRPDSGIGYLLEGDIHGRFNDWTAAAKAYRAGLEKGNFVGLSERLHAAINKSKGPVAATEFANDWMKNHPADVGLPFYLGNLAVDSGDLAAAETYFAAAVKGNSSMPSPINNLAWVKAKLGKPGAVALAEQALTLAPDQPDVVDTLVFALVQDKQLPKAIATLKSVLLRTPDASNQRLELAKLYISAGDKPNAKSELEKVAAVGARFGKQAEVETLLKQVSK